jgi:hypothetical protein
MPCDLTSWNGRRPRFITTEDRPEPAREPSSERNRAAHRAASSSPPPPVVAARFLLFSLSHTHSHIYPHARTRALSLTRSLSFRAPPCFLRSFGRDIAAARRDTRRRTAATNARASAAAAARRRDLSAARTRQRDVRRDATTCIMRRHGDSTRRDVTDEHREGAVRPRGLGRARGSVM